MDRAGEWQDKGGKLEIPDGYFVCQADFDADEPYIVISNDTGRADADITLTVPKSLAYYLSVHSCGSERMRKIIRRNARRDVQNTIRKALGLDD